MKTTLFINIFLAIAVKLEYWEKAWSHLSFLKFYFLVNFSNDEPMLC